MRDKLGPTDGRRVIVIGSGPAGAIAARTLVHAGIPVIMLESGTEPPPGLLIRAMGRNVFRRRMPIIRKLPHAASGDSATLWYHDLAPGGLSNHWTGAVPRFAPADFCEGARLHDRYRWPLQYDDLALYYAKVERLVGIVGDPRPVPNLPAPCVTYRRVLSREWQRVAAGAARLGYGLTATPLADGAPWLVRRTSTAFNSFTDLVRPLQHSPLFELRLGAHALRLEWSGAARRVTSVLYHDRRTLAQCRIDGAAVVVAAGALSSTKLLLDSSCPDFPSGLGDTEGLLGRYLHDHPYDMVAFDVDRPLARPVGSAYVTRGPYETAQPLLAAASVVRGSASALERVLSLAPTKTTSFAAIIFGTMPPEETNYVAPDPIQKDRFGLPVLDIHMRFAPVLAQTTAAAKSTLFDILESGGYRCTERWALDRLTPGASVHYGGTVRMHASPRHGMLNGWNRLHAVDNVVVADASSFTTGPEKNPALTIMALAMRAAGRLAHDLRASQVGTRE